jgi:hypothetical protein
MDRNYTPLGTVSLDCDTSTDRVLLHASPVQGKDVVVYNSDATDIGFIAFGDSTVTTAASTGFPIPPATQIRLRAPHGTTYVAGITSSGTALLYFTSGTGS